MIWTIIGLVLGVSLSLFGYRFVRVIAPFVFFVFSIVGVFRWLDSSSQNLLYIGTVTVLMGTLVGVLLATFSSVVISLGAVALSVVVVYTVLDVYILRSLGVPNAVADYITILTVLLFLLMSVGTYLMRYIGIFVSSCFGAFLLFVVFNELAGVSFSVSAPPALDLSRPWIPVACGIIALLGMVVQIGQHRASQRPFSERGMWSLQDYTLD